LKKCPDQYDFRTINNDFVLLDIEIHDDLKPSKTTEPFLPVLQDSIKVGLRQAKEEENLANTYKFTLPVA